MAAMKRIESEQDVEEVFQADQVIVYKHSPTCGICVAALQEMEKFMGDHPEAPVRLVDVLAHRDLSRRIAAKTGIPHESPQVILLRRGTPSWNASHDAITAEAVASGVAAIES
jgi:bacillithiol system protein YtxJ